MTIQLSPEGRSMYEQNGGGARTYLDGGGCKGGRNLWLRRIDDSPRHPSEVELGQSIK